MNLPSELAERLSACATEIAGELDGGDSSSSRRSNPNTRRPSQQPARPNRHTGNCRRFSTLHSSA